MTSYGRMGQWFGSWEGLRSLSRGVHVSAVDLGEGCKEGEGGDDDVHDGRVDRYESLVCDREW